MGLILFQNEISNWMTPRLKTCLSLLTRLVVGALVFVFCFCNMNLCTDETRCYWFHFAVQSSVFTLNLHAPIYIKLLRTILRVQYKHVWLLWNRNFPIQSCFFLSFYSCSCNTIKPIYIEHTKECDEFEISGGIHKFNINGFDRKMKSAPRRHLVWSAGKFTLVQENKTVCQPRNVWLKGSKCYSRPSGMLSLISHAMSFCT